MRAYYIHKGLLFACMATAWFIPIRILGQMDTYNIYIRHGVTPHSSKCVLLQCQWYGPEEYVSIHTQKIHNQDVPHVFDGFFT